MQRGVNRGNAPTATTVSRKLSRLSSPQQSLYPPGSHYRADAARPFSTHPLSSLTNRSASFMWPAPANRHVAVHHGVIRLRCELDGFSPVLSLLLACSPFDQFAKRI